MADFGSKAGEVNWGDVWFARQGAHGYSDTPEQWDKRAPTFGARFRPGDYILAFIDKLELEPGDTVLDMGCGNGGVAIPLTQAGHKVLACDFSPGMLAAMEELCAKKQVTGIDARLMSWEDDWDAHGVGPGCVDVAFASRSMITHDLRDSLKKLTRACRKRACATLGTGYTPKVSASILRQLGICTMPEYDYQYAFNILVQEGYQPSVSFIRNDRRHHYESEEHARECITGMLDKAAPVLDPGEYQAARPRVAAWVHDNLQANPLAGTVNDHGETEGPYCICMPNDIVWAFLSWEPVRY